MMIIGWGGLYMVDWRHQILYCVLVFPLLLKNRVGKECNTGLTQVLYAKRLFFMFKNTFYKTLIFVILDGFNNL